MAKRVPEIGQKQLDKAIREALAKIEQQGGKVAIGVADRLTLHVVSDVAMSWIFRYLRKDGTRVPMGLGAYPSTGLAVARAKAQEQRDLLSRGIDPIEHRDALKAADRGEKIDTTFETQAKAYIESHRRGWSNAKHAQQWENTLKQHAYPVIGNKPVAEIETDHILEVLKPIWLKTPETAGRVRNRIELILDAAKVRKLRDGENPARWRGHLDKLLPSPKKVKPETHHPALDYSNMPTLWPKLVASTRAGNKALRFLILTATRTSEVTGALWDEFDLEAGLWTIPGSRMKAGKPHTVPLSDAALDLLREQEKNKAKGTLAKYVFPGRRGVMSQMTMAMALRSIDKTCTVHGFRSTFRDWAADETHYPNIVCEKALAHTIPDKVEKAYRRGDLLERRKALMKDWASFVTTKPADNVVQIKKTSEA